MQHDAVRFTQVYAKEAYVPVSFALCLIALHFPLEPTKEDISTYNLWLNMLLEVLPIRNKCLRDLVCDEERLPNFSTRQEFFKLVKTLHKLILGKDLETQTILRLCSGLRATECKKPSEPGKEAGCSRTLPPGEAKTCCVVLFTRTPVTGSMFSVAPNVTLPMVYDMMPMLEQEFLSDHAFCSCYFSVKWFMLHLVASGFPQEPTKRDKYLYHTFLSLFGKVLACSSCKVNFQSNLQLSHYSPEQDLVSNVRFVEFVFELHNCVNAMLKKKCVTTVDETRRFYDKLCERLETGKFGAEVVIVREEDALTRFYLEG